MNDYCEPAFPFYHPELQSSMGMTLRSCDLDVRVGGGYRLVFGARRVASSGRGFGAVSDPISTGEGTVIVRVEQPPDVEKKSDAWFVLQDDVALLKTQLYLGLGRTADARKAADTINLENPERKQARPLAASIIGEAWARTGKPKEALALVDTIEVPSSKDGEQIAMQIRVVRVFARFAANQRKQAESDLVEICEDDDELLGAAFQRHPSFPRSVNVGFMERQSERNIRLRVFERGAKAAKVGEAEPLTIAVEQFERR